MGNTISIIGSSNIDLIMKLPRLPRAAETVANGNFLQTFGGKGANTAVACARAGGRTAFVGCLGNDAYAGQVVDNLRADGIDTSRIMVESDVPSGTALIMIDENGENYLAVAPGANGRFDIGRVRANEDVIRDSAMILLQREIPVDATNEILRLAGTHSTPVLFNYAPAGGLEVKVGPEMTILTVNEVEAGALAGREVADVDGALTVAAELVRAGPEVVVVTLGGAGVVAVSKDQREVVPAFRVDPVDTTAAGDTFCGSFAVARVEGKSMIEAIRFANAAAAISVTGMGAQPSIPKRAGIDAFLAKNG